MRHITLLHIAVAAGGMVISAAVADTVPPPAETPAAVMPADTTASSPASLPETAADSLAATRAAEATERAAGLYKTVKFMLYEGELEQNLYPAVYEANRAATEALETAITDADRTRAVSILSDLSQAMMHGALYYSGQGDSRRQAEFARAYIDTQLNPAAVGAKFSRDPKLFPSLAYCAAYGAINDGDTEAAKRYFELYLDSGEQSQRQNVIKYFGQACLTTGDWLRGIEVLEQGTRDYPADIQILTLALQTCLDGGLTERMQPLLDKALLINPNDEKLQNLQAQLFERNQNFRQAVDIYLRLAETHPESLEIRQHIASCYYNLGASHYNSSIMEEDEKRAARHRRQSKTYFQSAATALGHVLANTPSDMRYLKALAHTYASLGEREKFDDINNDIRAFGGEPVAFNSMPVLLGTSGVARDGETLAAVKIPSYDEFARPYIEKRLAAWAARGEFEKLDDYSRRLSGGDAERAYKALNDEAGEEYLKTYGRQLVLTDLRRSDYDADNEIYRIDTPYGSTVVKVPMKNHEAEAFKAGWETAQIRAPRFIIRDGRVALGRITYVVNGKKYTYDADDNATYVTPSVYVDINGILAGVMQPGDKTAARGELTGVWKESDVDRDIPVTGRKADAVHALIIANEQYEKASAVFGALHDGATFRDYCTRTLGIPADQTVLVNNATGNQVRDALATLARRVRGTGPEAEVIVYYAGHGLPDDATREAYMMPVDANPLVMSTLIPMKEIYAQLGNMRTASTAVFIDACFSGTDREGSMLKEGRGVALKTKAAAPQGDMFVLTAASAQETAMPYKEKHHGLFTYFLLKKIQESKGNATLRQIADYVITNVRTASEAVNGKPQNPTVSTSGSMTTLWEDKRLKP